MRKPDSRPCVPCISLVNEVQEVIQDRTLMAQVGVELESVAAERQGLTVAVIALPGETATVGTYHTHRG